jgi:hypothetical protein
MSSEVSGFHEWSCFSLKETNVLGYLDLLGVGVEEQILGQILMAFVNANTLVAELESLSLALSKHAPSVRIISLA